MTRSQKLFVGLIAIMLCSTVTAQETLWVPLQYSTLQAAVNAANLSAEPDVTIILLNRDEPYRISQAVDPNDPNGIDITRNNLTIRSQSLDPTRVVIDCRTPGGLETGRAFTINDNVTGFLLDGVTITGGEAVLKSLPADPNSAPGFSRDPNEVNGEEVNTYKNADDGVDQDTNGEGGAIRVGDGAQVIIRNCIFRDNRATGGRGGDGGEGGSVPEDQRVSGDQSSWFGSHGGRGGDGQGDGQGGAIFCGTNSHVTIRNNQFIGNLAMGGIAGNGGAGGIGGNNGQGGNGGDAGDYGGRGSGGAIYVTASAVLDIENNQFTANLTDGPVQGVPGAMGTPEGDEPHPEDGASGSRLGIPYPSGGAIYYAADGNIRTISDCYFAENMAAGGGAIYVDPNNTITLTTCEFENNLAGSGGVVFLDDLSNLTIDESLFVGNSCDWQGGVIYAHTNSTVTLNNSDFESNGFSQRVIDGFTRTFIPESGGAVYGAPGTTINLYKTDFLNNSAREHGGAISLIANNANRGTFTADDCAFVNSRAFPAQGQSPSGSRGGALNLEYVQNSRIEDCRLIGNLSHDGGAIYLNQSQNFGIIESILGDNEAKGTVDAWGGAMLVFNSTPQIRHTRFEYNYSSGDGGAIVFGGGAPVLENCLITGNTADFDGAAVYSFFSSPEMTNCTVAENTGTSAIYGEGVFIEGSGNFYSLTMTDSIIAYNSTEYAFHAGDYDFNLSHSVVYESSGSDTGRLYKRQGSTYSEDDLSGNPEMVFSDPQFETGVLGEHYLQRTSPAVGSGSQTAQAAGLDDRTTDKDFVIYIAGAIVDRGFHYSDPQLKAEFTLTVVVFGEGSMEGTPALSFDGTSEYTTQARLGATVDLTAIPALTWRVGSWSGTEDDTSTKLSNTVKMYFDREVVVVFSERRILEVGQGMEFSKIEDAVAVANDWDIIVVSSGIHRGSSFYVDKQIEIRSKNPEDPATVATTILDYDEYVGPQIIFGPHTDNNTILNGFTIRNNEWTQLPYLQWEADPADLDDRDGRDGATVRGGTIRIAPGSSPIIKNCIIRDNGVIGAEGTDGKNANADLGRHAGRGGWGGGVYGGAVYVGPNASPKFVNVQFLDNYAHGGDAGDGGNEDGTWLANYGGFHSEIGYHNHPVFAILPTQIVHVFEPLWQFWGLGQDYRWFTGMGGAVYCDTDSYVTFIDCTISGNSTRGGVSGLGGTRLGVRMRPRISYEIPSFGGGVFGAERSTIRMVNTTLDNNVANKPSDTYFLDPYLGHGGGIATKGNLIFENCIIHENIASAGGGVYWFGGEGRISESIIRNNYAYHGGGVLVDSGTGVVYDTTITENRARPDYPEDPNNPGTVIADPNVIILGEGGGLLLLNSDLYLVDNIITNNFAEAYGGAIWVGAGKGDMFNLLVTGNHAGIGGGGIAANLAAEIEMGNMTIANNLADSQHFAESYGGGVFAVDGSLINIINSIIWGNTAYNGRQIALRYGDSSLSFHETTVDVQYSNVQGGPQHVYLEQDTHLLGYDPEDPDAITNLHGTSLENPLWVGGTYYLSDPGTEDETQTQLSPCIGIASDTAADLGLFRHTTRSGSVLHNLNDRADIGFHHILRSDLIGDFNFDGVIDTADLGLFNIVIDSGWASETSFPHWGFGRDLNKDGRVDNKDFALFAKHWNDQESGEDTTPPNPNPMTWLSQPITINNNSILLRATPATDNTGWPVEYQIDCVLAPPEHIDQDPNVIGVLNIDNGNGGWIDEPNTVHANLMTGHKYGYRVRARDQSFGEHNDYEGNKTKWSFIVYTVVSEASMLGIPEWAIEPYGISDTEIAMEATTTDDNGRSYTQYWFENTDTGQNSGWITSSSYTMTGLNPLTTYSFRVRARDADGITSDWSVTTSASTGSVPDDGGGDDPVDPGDSYVWSPTILSWWAEEAANWDGDGRPKGNGWNHFMEAGEVLIGNGRAPLWYRFECTAGYGTSSGWSTSPIYITGNSSLSDVFYRVWITDSTVSNQPNEANIIKMPFATEVNW